MTVTLRKRLCYFVGSLFVVLTAIDLNSPATGDVDCEKPDGDVCIVCEASLECAKPTKWVVFQRKFGLSN